MEIERRKFIKTALKGSGAVCLGITQLSCSRVVYVDGVVDKDKVKVPKSLFVENSFVVVRIKGLKAPVYLKKSDPYIALYMECTHKSCELRAHESNLTCPCHGSEFDTKGAVLEGPAEEKLKVFKTEEDEKNIYIY